MQLENKVRVLNALKLASMDRESLVAETGVARSTLFDLLKVMRKEGLTGKTTIKLAHGRPYTIHYLTEAGMAAAESVKTHETGEPAGVLADG